MLLLQHTYMYYKMTSNKKNEYSKLGFSPRFFLSFYRSIDRHVLIFYVTDIFG